MVRVHCTYDVPKRGISADPATSNASGCLNMNCKTECEISKGTGSEQILHGVRSSTTAYEFQMVGATFLGGDAVQARFGAQTNLYRV